MADAAGAARAGGAGLSSDERKQGAGGEPHVRKPGDGAAAGGKKAGFSAAAAKSAASGRKDKFVVRRGAGAASGRQDDALHAKPLPRVDVQAGNAEPAPLKAVSPARAAAFAILTRVATTAGHSDDLLHAPAVDALSAEDRNLTMALVLGVLRWQLALDAQIKPMLQRPDAELHPAALLALRLAIFQMEHMSRIPAHAAIHESVELAKANGAFHASAMVNALLRRWQRERAAAGASQQAPKQTLVSVSPAEVAHPAWLMGRWRAKYGGRAARLIAGYDQAEPPVGGLFDDAGDAPVNRFGGYALPSIDDGSRLVAEIAAAAVTEPKRILDACAAPGGKARVLALRHPGAEIVAADVSEKRLLAMRARLEKEPAAAAITTVLADMTVSHVKAAGAEAEGGEAEAAPGGGDAAVDGEARGAGAARESNPLLGSFDLILVDAPCSGTGTLARNPEIRHRLRESDLPRQAERQRAIVRTALRRLAPGGRLVYSTCSLEAEENEAVVLPLVEAGEVAVEPLGLERLPGLSDEVAGHLRETAVTEAGALRTLPGVHACDGFFAVVLRKA